MLSWKNFWTSNPKSFGIVMQKSTEYFVEKCLRKNLIKSNTSILDYGCGPGYLAAAITNIPSYYLGVDISETYIETCIKKFKHLDNFKFQTLHTTEEQTNSTNTELLKQHFDTIIILSVIQYLENKEQLVQLLVSLLPSLKPSGDIILADVIESDKGFLKDIFFIGIYSVVKGYLFQFLQFVIRLRFSNYNTIRLNNKLLMLSQKEIEDICRQLNLQCTIIEACTLQRSRKTYRISL